ncbi:hypothetical protein AAFX91_26930 [Bradyrhizobium sp. 31Argb]|nr:hypothetical protein CWO89_21125 [Bradyrhizobium sp. Leo170]
MTAGYPETRGERPADLERRLKYNAALTRVAMQDAAVHRLLVEVQRLLRSPSVLQDPAVDWLGQRELIQLASSSFSRSVTKWQTD